MFGYNQGFISYHITLIVPTEFRMRSGDINRFGDGATE